MPHKKGKGEGTRIVLGCMRRLKRAKAQPSRRRAKRLQALLQKRRRKKRPGNFAL
jgi:hypothetical protein